MPVENGQLDYCRHVTVMGSCVQPAALTGQSAGRLQSLRGQLQGGGGDGGEMQPRQPPVPEHI